MMPKEPDSKMPDKIDNPTPEQKVKFDHEKKVHDEKMKAHQEAVDAWKKTAKAILAKVVAAELAKKRNMRMPYCIVPDAPFEIGVKDKENNSVFRVIVYKPQQEDVIKAFRRKGYTPRLFVYDKPAWEKEKQERKLIKEQVDNATTQLHKNAVGCYQ